MSIYSSLGVRSAINARGYSTKIGGSLMAPEVVRAMQEAASCYVRIEDLQEAAGKVIAEITGAEAGYVTSGASASLTLAIAACITRLDPDKMDRLPDTTGMKNQVVVQLAHRTPYDHALRAAGAQLVEIDQSASADLPSRALERALNDRTAAAFFLAGFSPENLPLDDVVRIAHRHDVPVIVDAATVLPPTQNLRAFIDARADLVAFSGGKHIRGPQASGILCGRRDLILAAALQHQDMDVFPETWSYRNLILEGKVSRPPAHGIGRGLKVGKEEIVGLVTALQLYVQRDFEAELGDWKRKVQAITGGLHGINGIQAEMVFPQPNGRPVPAAHVRVDSVRTGRTADWVINVLQEGEPMICTYEGQASEGTVVIFPQGLEDRDLEVIVRRFKELFNG